MDLDLSRHAVLEASAGTGKTYAIEQLVLRLLKERLARIEQILVVTFTEKATGELKSRLRAALESERAAAIDVGARQTLCAALDDFDQAPIFTIHGFCQRLLQDYPIEKGHDFGGRLIYDDELIDEAVHQVQTCLWPRTFGPHLQQVMDWAELGGGGMAKLHSRVRGVVLRFRPALGHRLDPAPPASWAELLAEQEPSGDFGDLLTAYTAERAAEQIVELKRQRGLFSFDDLLTRVCAALDQQQNPEADRLLELLRQRFRFGIVDEFQDTDPVQWQIFRRIFLDGGASRLFIVGDPKQAIYNFRGADLPTYLQAVEHLQGKSGAQFVPLGINWRSTPQLLEGLNRLFEQGEFFPSGAGIDYRRVDPPPSTERNVHVVEDATSRPALTIVDCNGPERAKTARENYARFIAKEIAALLGGGRPRLIFERKGTPRTLQAGDIGILVFRRSEAEELQEALSQAGVPWTFYKVGSIWDGVEARHTKLLLRTLMEPTEGAAFRLALLTEFFQQTPADLTQAGDIPPSHPARQLFERWAAFCEARDWGGLFASLLEDTGLLANSVVSTRGVRGNQAPPERRLANYRTIFTRLQQAAYGDNLDLPALVAWLDKKLAASRAELDPEPIATDQARVNILTIHSAKGLEFPVVFLLGGFTNNSRKDEVVSYHDGRGIVFDLNGNGKTHVTAQRQDETRRLLYVALTRAMIKLYVPYLERLPRVAAGPVNSLLVEALKQSGLIDADPSAVSAVVKPDNMPTLAAPSNVAKEAGAEAASISDPLFLRLDAAWAKRRVAVRSFSSLRRPEERAPHFGEATRPPDETPSPLAPPDALRGVVFGDLIHDVLERIDFAAVGAARSPAELLNAGTPSARLIKNAVRRAVPLFDTRLPSEQLEATALQAVANLVWQTLHTPLARVGGPLWQIGVADRVHELAFHYPKVATSVGAGEEIFITGFIDLVFRAQDRWFLLDWKTNFLADYSPASLANCMIEADYHRQHELYAEALQRWLRRRSVTARFEGVYYLFVRGLNGRDETSGVFFQAAETRHQPTLERTAFVGG